MTLEVEQKFRVADLDAVAALLRAMGVVVQSPVQETDLYFQHPARDFAATDEALRIRQKAGTCFLTYKGPKLDPVTKTRREIDLRLPESAATFPAFRELLEALGFRPVAEVHKRRCKAYVPWQDARIEVSLDQVHRVGVFVELELLATPDTADLARQRIRSLADRLELHENERRSYLELFLTADNAAP